MTQAHENFITYVRTKQFFGQLKHRDTDTPHPVHIPMNEIKSRFFNNPRPEIELLKQEGKLQVTEQTTKNGYTAFLYKVTETGGINPAMLKSQPKQHTPIEAYIMACLKKAGLKKDAPSTVYFDSFLHLKNKYIDLFFTVDDFAGRIHTPVSNFHRNYRQNLLIEGHAIASIDVVTMQPLLLGKILTTAIGDNAYSDWINAGKDIYLMIMERMKLGSRDEAKTRFFEIVFSKPNQQLSEMFGHAAWIEWINAIKSEPIAYNPHTLEKQHSNLAWLLQNTEVRLMRKVWKALRAADIPFLTVHDEVIMREQDAERSMKIFDRVLRDEFAYFRLEHKGMPQQPLPKELHEPVYFFNKPEPPKPDQWEQDITDLEKWFTVTGLPPTPLNLTPHETITDVPRFIEGHISTLKANNGNPTFRPYLDRLIELRGAIEKINNNQHHAI